MKLVNKLTQFTILIIAISGVLLNQAPTYETPTIVRKTSPFNQPFNPRIDTLNDSSAANYQRYKNRQNKNNAESELIRFFDIERLKAWLKIMESENLDELTNKDVINNISNIVGKSSDLQNYINFKAGLVNKKLALLDMKLKQVDVLDNAIESIQQHPGDINSNLGSNLLWKYHLESVMENIAVTNSNFQTGSSTICEILQNSKEVTENIPSSSTVQKDPINRQYIPDQEFISNSRDGENAHKNAEYEPKSPKRNPLHLKKGKHAHEKSKKEHHEVEKEEPTFIQKKTKKNNNSTSIKTKKEAVKTVSKRNKSKSKNTHRH